MMIFAVAALAACARTEPADQSLDELDEAPEVGEITDTSAGNASTNTSPAAPSGHQWFTRAEAGNAWAGYGPPNSEAAFSVRCEGDQLVFNTTEMPPSGPGATTMRIEAGSFSQELSAQASEEGLPNTEASVPADTQWLSQLASASGNLSVTVGGSDPVVAPIADPLVSLIRDCGR